MLRRLTSTPPPLLSAVLWLLGACAGAGTAAGNDPRVELVDLHAQGRPEEALRQLEEVASGDPSAVRRLGLDYLRGHLLLELDRRQEAFAAFAAAMGSTPELGPFSRYRLALEQERLGHPEVAAGLVATLLRSSPPRTLVGPGLELLRRSVIAGGDCRVLSGLERQPFRTSERRQLALAEAECRWRDGAPEEAWAGWLGLLEDDRGDVVARLAAERLAAVDPEKKDARSHMLVGLTFHHHREFSTAIQHLARALVQLPGAKNVSRREAFELRYTLARSHFWEKRYRPAAAAFASLAADTPEVGRRAQVLYQEGRCHELAGDWKKAEEVFLRAYNTEPSGGWSDSALIAALRLAWLSGDETTALAHLETLLNRRFYSTGARALLFLASSELVAGDPTRAGDWLARAARLKRTAPREVAYWQGRHEELLGRPEAAVEHYLETLHEDPYHPLAEAARRRLGAPELAVAARKKARQLRASGSVDDLYGAWLLSGDARTRRAVVERLAGDRRTAAFLSLGTVPAADWPLWSADLRRPEEMLLALGLFGEGGSAVLRHFPVTEPGLAFTGGLVLARLGDVPRSLYVAEILLKRVPRDLPQPLLPEPFERLLYPLPYAEMIAAESARRDVDPYLLAAVIREESRFDPTAFSAASARGLTQFVFPTARVIAERSGLGRIAPEDLERPEVAIALGAAYLRQIADQLGDSEPQVVAAYNAGEPQAALWRRYCKSGETEEYLTKVTFKETRGYLSKVLTSRAHYAELYGPGD